MFNDQKYYPSAKLYGLNKLLIEYFNLKKDFIFPITIPHGVMLKNEYRDEIDLHCHEPLYMAFNQTIYKNTFQKKKSFCFPHPWLLITKNYKLKKNKGTLIILPPPNLEAFNKIYEYITDNKLDKPIGVLVKKRNDTKNDYSWWEEKGINTYTAGDIYSKNFYYNLLKIFDKFEYVATPNMSSAAIFAASIKKKIIGIPNIVISTIEDRNNEFKFYKPETEEYINVQKIWRRILSNNIEESSKEASKILGIDFMNDDEFLKNKIISSISQITNTPIHLYPLHPKKNFFLYFFLVKLIRLGAPIQKLFPNPINKVSKNIKSKLKLNSIFVTKISDFSYFKICGEYIEPKILKYKRSEVTGPTTAGMSLRKKIF